MSVSASELADQLSRLMPRPAVVPEPSTPAASTPASPAVPAVVPASDPAAAPAPPAPPVVAAPVPPVPVAPVGPCQVVDHASRGVQLDVTALPGEVVSIARLMDARGFAIDAVTGVDWLAAGEMEVIYDYFHPLSGLRVSVRARLPRDNPEIPTIQGVFPGANWHERETHDFFGIRFAGHPNLAPLLLPEDADYHPLRKDFSQ